MKFRVQGFRVEGFSGLGWSRRFRGAGFRVTSMIQRKRDFLWGRS